MRSFRLESRKRAYDELDTLFRNPEKVYIIHYSCGPFSNSGNSPKIVSISLTNLATKQSISFSIHLAAEILNLPLDQLNPHQFCQAETKLLRDFIKFLHTNKDCLFVHWSMNNSTFGFEALFHRYWVLCGEKNLVPSIRKVDLHNLLEGIYSEGYEFHHRLIKRGRDVKQLHGRLLCLAYRNKIKLFAAMSGVHEVEHFCKNAYYQIHESTLRKTFILRRIIKLAYVKELKVRRPFLQYGRSVQGIFEYARSNWLGALMLTLLGALIQLVFSKILT